MNAELKTKWIAALRSGDYPQGRGSMRPEGGRYCCLAVMRDGLGVNPFDIHGLDDYRAALINMNDGLKEEPKRSFTEIADWIEANVPVSGGEATEESGK